MSLEENKAIVHKFVEIAFSKQDWDRLDDLVAPNYVDPDYPQLGGREGLKQMMNMAFKAFPDWYETIEDISAEEDKVWVLLACSGTLTGEFMGIAPTGKKVTIMAVDIYRIANGKIVWCRRIPTPDLAFFKQVGIVEYTEQGKKLFPDEAK
jgi:predicted ester cyclase